MSNSLSLATRSFATPAADSPSDSPVAAGLSRGAARRAIAARRSMLDDERLTLRDGAALRLRHIGVGDDRCSSN